MSNKSIRFSLAFFIFTLFIALLIGCAGKKPFWGDEKTGFILSYRLAPDEMWKYNSTASQSMNMEQMGQSVDVETNSFSYYTIKGNGIDNQKNISATITVDSMSIVSSGMGRENKPDLSPFIGKSFGLTFTAKGKELELPGADSITIDLGMMGGGKQSIKTYFRTILPDLPNRPVKIGDTWTEHDTSKVKQGGMDITVSIESTHTLEASETFEGIECLKIASKSKGTLNGEGQQMGANLNFEGELEGTGTWYFAYKQGSFVKANSENFMEGTVAVSGPADMTIPMTQEIKSEVKLILSSQTK